MCDVAEALLVEQVEQDTRARWAAAGDDFTPQAGRDRLEEWLGGGFDGPPPGMDAEQWELRRSLGVA